MIPIPVFLAWSNLMLFFGMWVGRHSQRETDEKLAPALKGMPKTAP